MRTLLVACLVALAGCGKVKDPTPKGQSIIDWDRSSAKARDLDDVTKAGPPHPIADAKILEGPNTRSYTVTVTDGGGKGYKVEVAVESAKVAHLLEGKEVTRWATVGVTAKILENDAFRIDGSCDDHVASVLAAPGEITNTMLDCRVVGKRPNNFGDEDAITTSAYLQFEGTGKLFNNDPKVKIEER